MRKPYGIGTGLRLAGRHCRSSAALGPDSDGICEIAEPRPALDCSMIARLQSKSRWLAASEAER